MASHPQATLEFTRYQQWLTHLSENSELLFAGQLLARAARLRPSHTGLIMSDGTAYTYQELHEYATRISILLQETYQLKPQQRVMICVRNSPFFYAAYYGAWQLGAIVVPVNTFLKNVELLYILNDAQPALLIIEENMLQSLQAEQAQLPPTITEKTELPAATSRTVSLQRLPEHELAALLYTSGTTGHPKGVMLSSYAIMHNVAQVLSRFEFVPEERIFCPLPLFHSFTQNTCLWSAMAATTTVILVPSITRSHIQTSLGLKPTVVLGIPGFFALLCRINEISLDSVRYCISGGDALPPNIRRFFALRFGRLLCNGYGLTEAGPVIAASLDDCFHRNNLIGKPLPDIRYELRESNPVGILWVQGPNLMNGYYNAPEATAAVLKDGWLDTGDLARTEDDGTLILCGREKDLIIHRGLKIYPQEVEALLVTYPNIAVAAVVGKNNAYDEYPVAYIETIDHIAISEETLRSWCAERLAPYKVPRAFYRIEKMPMTTTGKIDKKELRNRN